MQEKFIENFKEALEVEEGTTVALEDKFRELEDWDSLARLSVIAMLDEEYNLQIEEEDFEKLVTVEDLFNKVQG